MFMGVIAEASNPDKSRLLMFLSNQEPIRQALQNWALKTDPAAISDPGLAQSVQLMRKLDKPWVDLLAVLAPTGVLNQLASNPLMKIDEMVNSVALNLLINPEQRSKLDLGKLGASLKALVDSGYANQVAGEDGVKLRRALAFITTVAADAKGTPSYVNLSALVEFIQSVQKNLDARRATMQKENKPAPAIQNMAKSVDSVLSALYQFALGQPEALLRMEPQLIADFFADPANAAAAGALLQRIDLSKLSEYKPLFDVLKQYWYAPSIAWFSDDNKTGHGFHKVFADKGLIEFLQARGRGEGWSENYQYATNPVMRDNSTYLSMLGQAMASLPNAPTAASTLPKDAGIPLNTSGITNATPADPGQNVAPGAVPAAPAALEQPARAPGQ
jgi:hypothetical protein